MFSELSIYDKSISPDANFSAVTCLATVFKSGPFISEKKPSDLLTDDAESGDFRLPLYFSTMIFKFKFFTTKMNSNQIYIH